MGSRFGSRHVTNPPGRVQEMIKFVQINCSDDPIIPTPNAHEPTFPAMASFAAETVDPVSAPS
jgi:hypothetical protein